MKKNQTILRTIAAVLLAVLLLSSLAGCRQNQLGEPLMTMEEETLTVGIYQLLLSRTCWMIERSGADISSDSFWRTFVHADGKDMTFDEYYRTSVLNNCKNYLIASYLFRQYGLSLSDAVKDQIEADIDLLVDTDAGGSRSEFNQILGQFGANIDILRELYLMEARIRVLEAYLYGASGELISASVKDAYVAEHYVHFKQILLPTYYYVYESDKNNDTIYYYDSGAKKDHICYDIANGIPDADGKKDENGDLIYYTAEGKIAYDTKKGTPAYRIDANGTYVVEKYDAETVKDLKQTAEDCVGQITPGDFAAFEALMKQKNDKEDGQNDHYTDGYYICSTDQYSGSGSYLSAIVKQLETLEEGECAIVESDYGFHVIMKYGMESGAYEKTVNEDFFTDLTDRIIEKLFLEECAKHADRVTVDDKILGTVGNMWDIKPNQYY